MYALYIIFIFFSLTSYLILWDMGEKQDSKTVMNLGPPTIIHFDVKTLWIYICNYIAKHWGDQRTMDFTNGRDLM